MNIILPPKFHLSVSCTKLHLLLFLVWGSWAIALVQLPAGLFPKQLCTVFGGQNTIQPPQWNCTLFHHKEAAQGRWKSSGLHKGPFYSFKYCFNESFCIFWVFGPLFWTICFTTANCFHKSWAEYMDDWNVLGKMKSKT